MKTINNPQEDLHEGDYILFQKPSGPEVYSYLGLVKNPKTGRVKVITNGTTIRSMKEIKTNFCYDTNGETIFLHNKGKKWWPSDIAFVTNISLVDQETIKELIQNQKITCRETIDNDRQQLKKLNKALKQMK